MMVPIRIGVKDYIRLDTSISIRDGLKISLDDTIPIDQKLKLPIFGKSGPNVPVQGNILLKQNLNIDFRESIPVQGMIPVDMIIIDTLPIGIKMTIPVEMLVPVNIPLKTSARISFPNGIPVHGNIPIDLTIPVDIPVGETALAEYFNSLAKGLRELANLKHAL